MPKETKEKLLDLLLERALLYDPIEGFRLSSGKISTYYFDCKRLTLSSRAVLLIGEALWEKVKDLKVQGVGGLTLGADPLVMAVCAYACLKNIPLEGFIVRKEPKKHGTQRWLEGYVHQGDRVVIVDDVITTGKSVLQAIEKAEDAGLEVVKVVVLVDREEGGREKIVNQGYDFSAVFSFTEIKQAWEKKHGRPFLTNLEQKKSGNLPRAA